MPRDWAKLCLLVKLRYCQHRNNYKIFQGTVSWRPYRRACLNSKCALAVLHCIFLTHSFFSLLGFIWPQYHAFPILCILFFDLFSAHGVIRSFLLSFGSLVTQNQQTSWLLLLFVVVLLSSLLSWLYAPIWVGVIRVCCTELSADSCRRHGRKLAVLLLSLAIFFMQKGRF